MSWRTRRKPSLDELLDLEAPTYPGELDRPMSRQSEDERNAADLDEIEAEEANPWERELDRLAELPTVTVSVTALGRSAEMSFTGPLRITRQVVEVVLAELDRPDAILWQE